MKMDCHIHTYRCGHATGDVADYVAAAHKAELDIMTFTEHFPLPTALDPRREYSMDPHEVEPYLKAVRTAADTSGSLQVFAGFEVDWLSGQADRTRDLLARFDPDVVFGSVHFIDGWAFDDPRLIDRYQDADIDALWARYFDLFAQAASSGLFDVMAHPDLIKKFCFYPSGNLSEYYEAAAAVLGKTGVAIEVSSGGLRKPCAELYPSVEFLAACCRAGVPVTIGSDAHRPDEVGNAFTAARDALLKAGYTSAVYFEARTLKEVPL